MLPLALLTLVPVDRELFARCEVRWELPTLTGPESLTRRERVRLIGAALGRELTYVDLPRDEAIAQLALVMGEYAEWYLDGIAQLVDHPQPAVPTVTELTGRPGVTFAEWARGRVDMFR